MRLCTSTHAIDTAMARRMVEASAIRGSSMTDHPGGRSFMLKLKLGVQRTDKSCHRVGVFA